MLRNRYLNGRLVILLDYIPSGCQRFWGVVSAPTLSAKLLGVSNIHVNQTVPKLVCSDRPSEQSGCLCYPWFLVMKRVTIDSECLNPLGMNEKEN
jgi:hypothetical protein